MFDTPREDGVLFAIVVASVALEWLFASEKDSQTVVYGIERSG